MDLRLGPRVPRPRLNLLELSLAAGVVGVSVAGLPLGLAGVANGGLVTAALTLRTVADPAQPDLPPCPPLVMLLLRVVSWVPVGDLGTRINLAACVAAGLAAVLLSRLIARVLRDLNEGRGGPPLAGEGIGIGDETIGPGALRRGLVEEGETTGVPAAAGAGPEPGKTGPQIFGEKGVAVDPLAVAPAPRRRTGENHRVTAVEEDLDGDATNEAGHDDAVFREPTVRVAAVPPRERTQPVNVNVHEATTRPVSLREATGRMGPAPGAASPTMARRAAGREPTGRPNREATMGVVPVSLREPTGRAAPVARREMTNRHAPVTTSRARAAERTGYGPKHSQAPGATVGREPTARVRSKDGGDAGLAGPLRGQVRLPTHQGMAVLGGVIAPLATVAVFVALTSSPTTAVSLALVVGAWLRLLAFERSPGTPRRALVLALLAGLALAADPVTPLFVWPPLLLCGLRWFRRGERWPLAAPLAFAAGVVAALPATAFLADESGPRRFAALAIDQLGAFVSQRPAPSTLLAVAAEGLGQLGIVAALVAAVGAAVLLTRRPRLFAFSLTMAAVALGLVAAQTQLIDGTGAGPNKGYGLGTAFGAGATAWSVMMVSFAVPLAVGISHLSGKLGAARGGAALAIAVMVAVWPAFDGGWWRFQRSRGVAVNEAVLAGIENKLAPAVAAIPGSPAADALLRYGQAVGRRPDLLLPAVVRSED